MLWLRRSNANEIRWNSRISGLFDANERNFASNETNSTKSRKLIVSTDCTVCLRKIRARILFTESARNTWLVDEKFVCARAAEESSFLYYGKRARDLISWQRGCLRKSLFLLKACERLAWLVDKKVVYAREAKESFCIESVHAKDLISV
jgi:hypothetical protein